ncbi:MAG: hypothetical protein HJJLKODD_01501 [Phycisphaerae bacterium]|nr:hypothetical protein [Phycisphaerae bacterium]
MKRQFSLLVLFLFMAGCSTPANDNSANDNSITPPAGGGNGNFNLNDNLAGLPECTTNAQCDDSQFCNGVETCAAGVCQVATAACTEDEICDEAANRCLQCQSSADCDDGAFCNGVETCNTQTGECLAGSAPCQTACLEASDTCAPCVVAADCGDDDPCTQEQCISNNCVISAIEGCCLQDDDCNDDDPCTDDVCNDSICEFEDKNCDDGLYCNGAETCADGDCIDAVNPPCSAPQTCNEAANVCEGDLGGGGGGGGGSGGGGPPSGELCLETCPYSGDGECDDGGPGSTFAACFYGTDCADCGERTSYETNADMCADIQQCCPAQQGDLLCQITCPETDSDCTHCVADSQCIVFGCSEPDPDCTNEQLCTEYLVCCEGDYYCDSLCPQPDADCTDCPADGTCTLGCDTPDPDCTNAVICQLSGGLYCCVGDSWCDGPYCPEPDADCTDCIGGDVCIEGCQPADPDC